MVFDPISSSHGLTHDFADLGGGCRAVKTGCNEDRDGFPGDTGLFKPGEQRWQDLPQASSARGGEATGLSSADSIAPAGSGKGRAERASRTRYRYPSGSVTVSPVFPNAKSIRIFATYHRSRGAETRGARI